MQKVEAADAKLSALTVKEKLLKEKEARLLKEKQKIDSAESKIVEARVKEQEMRLREDKLKAEEQKIVQAEAKLAQARAAEQRIAAQQKTLDDKQVLLQQAQEKLAQAAMREQAVQAKEAVLKAQELELASKVRIKEQAVQEKEVALKAQEQSIAAQARQLEQAKTQLSRERVVARAPVSALAPVQYQQQPTQNSLNAPVNSYSAMRQSAMSGRQAVSNISPSAAPSNTARQSSGFLAGNNIQRLLNGSGIGNISSLSQQSPNLYVWQANGLNGRAEISPQVSGQNISQYAQSFIAREKQNCRGDFASLPASLSGGKAGDEIACVSPNGAGKAMSIVFVQKGSDLMAISHETAADNMDAAIDARDKVASFL